MITQKNMQKNFDKLSDFNLIYIVNFEKLRFGEIIIGPFIKRHEARVVVKNLFGKKSVENPELPKEAIESFRIGNDIAAYNGIVYRQVVDTDGETYYDSFIDVTELVKQVLELPELKHTMKALSTLNGKAVMSKDLLSLPGFKPIENEEYGNISLITNELTGKGSKVRTSSVALNLTKDNLSFSIDLGAINYTIYGRRL